MPLCDHDLKELFVAKLDGVGPIDNRHSTDGLHRFVKKTKKKLKKNDIYIYLSLTSK